MKIPSDVDVPLYVKDEFGPFYKATFELAVNKENMRAVFVEYAWDMAWCDPCASDPMSNKELAELGARWIGSDGDAAFRSSGGSNVYVTRLHVRYDAKTFPEDLVLLETKDRGNFQGRYIMHHPWKGNTACEAANAYRQSLPVRFAGQAKNLAELTGWEPKSIAARMAQTGQPLDVK